MDRIEWKLTNPDESLYSVTIPDTHIIIVISKFKDTDEWVVRCPTLGISKNTGIYGQENREWAALLAREIVADRLELIAKALC